MDDSTEPKSEANRRYIVSLMIRVSVMRYVRSAQWVTTRFRQGPPSTRRDVNIEVMERCRRVTGCSVTRGRGAAAVTVFVLQSRSNARSNVVDPSHSYYPQMVEHNHVFEPVCAPCQSNLRPIF